MTRHELLARCRTILAGATERAEVAVYDRLPRKPGSGDGHVSQRLTLDVDGSTVEDMVREIDEALTGRQRDYTLDRESARRTVCALRSSARDDLLVDFLASRR